MWRSVPMRVSMLLSSFHIEFSLSHTHKSSKIYKRTSTKQWVYLALVLYLCRWRLRTMLCASLLCDMVRPRWRRYDDVEVGNLRTSYAFLLHVYVPCTVECVFLRTFIINQIKYFILMSLFKYYS